MLERLSGIKVRGGRRTFSGLHREQRVTRLESNIRWSDWEAMAAMAKVWGTFFFFPPKVMGTH